MLRSLDRWLIPWLTRRRARGIEPVACQHVFLAVCDHFEPLHRTDAAGAAARLDRWEREYPVFAGRVRDSSGRGPRHSFFYPVEQYDAAHVERIAGICRATGSEMEVQLHHDGDTEASLEQKLRAGIEQLRGHGALAQDPGGRTRFGFVHGNWALCNSRPDGRWCGVPTEIHLLRRLGCYADFTFPSAPSETQPRSVNTLGYAAECGSSAALDSLTDVRAGGGGAFREMMDRLLLVQGPLALNFARRKWGVLPRVENADLTGVNPPTAERFHLWLSQRIQVTGRGDWIFIKLHSHGAVPANTEALLGEPARAFYRWLCDEWRQPGRRELHFVTAREMVNLIHAAEDGWHGSPAGAFDYWLTRPDASR